MFMKHEFPQPFARNYESLLKRLKYQSTGVDFFRQKQFDSGTFRG
jgi:hypothetical protein